MATAVPPGHAGGLTRLTPQRPDWSCSTISLAGAERTPELDLIAQSVDAATARLRFLRLAFGDPAGRQVGRGEIASILRGVETASRVRYDWAAPDDPPRVVAKAAFLLLMCLESALPYGGSLMILAWLVYAIDALRR